MIWIAILAAGGLSFAMRISMLFLTNDRELPATADRALAVVAPMAALGL